MLLPVDAEREGGAAMRIGMFVGAAVIGCLALVATPVVVLAAVVSDLGGVAIGVSDLATALPTFGVADIPGGALADYVAAAGYCPGLPWTVLAGIGKVESDHGRSDIPGVHSGANAAGAEGPMQFLPATFAAYAVPDRAGDPTGTPTPYDLADAAVAAARLLCADGGGTIATLAQAVWDYNHSTAYVDDVLGWARTYGAAYDAARGGGAVAAAWALTQVGKPYRWGASGPDEYDCAGLAMRAWQAAGVGLPRIAADQYGAGRLLPVAAAAPGDLVFFASDPADPATIDHVGIYLGGGMMVDAPHTGARVRVEAVWRSGLVADVTRP
jgi:cell wall-associated NlpC family hydrolase